MGENLDNKRLYDLETHALGAREGRYGPYQRTFKPVVALALIGEVRALRAQLLEAQRERDAAYTKGRTDERADVVGSVRATADVLASWGPVQLSDIEARIATLRSLAEGLERGEHVRPHEAARDKETNHE